MARVAEAILFIAAAVLFFLLIVPWRNDPLPPAPQGTRTLPGLALGNPAPVEVAPAPATLLSLFVERVEKPPGSPARAPVLEAPWLRYVGFSDNGEGAVWYLKDTRSGRIIGVTTRPSRDGWCVVENRESRLVLKNGDSLYSVSTR
jgi:hypothetical protein